jgi:hypothetical protein
MALAGVDLEGHDAGIVGLKQPPAIAVTLRLDQLEAATSGYYRTLFTTVFITACVQANYSRSSGETCNSHPATDGARIFVRRSLSQGNLPFPASQLREHAHR